MFSAVIYLPANIPIALPLRATIQLLKKRLLYHKEKAPKRLCCSTGKIGIKNPQHYYRGIPVSCLIPY
jgi:hypothetical protein